MNPTDLRKAREESANIAYQTFIKHIREDKNGFFCFFEGKDAPYYSLRIQSILSPGATYPIICKGKKMVLKVYELIKNHKEYTKYKKAFFVDRDFDSSIIQQTNSDIYETPTYSIENFYCYPEVITEILKNELGLSEVDDSFKNAITVFKKLMTEMLSAQSLFNSWYYSLKEKKRNDGLDSTGVNLSEKFPKGYISLDLSGVTILYDLKKIKDDFPNAIQVDDEIILNFIDELNKVDKISFFRGKFLFEFVHTFIIKLIEDSNREQLIMKSKIKYHIEMKQMISSYSQYAITSNCLSAYLLSYR
jgi:hypothetical protein